MNQIPILFYFLFIVTLNPFFLFSNLLLELENEVIGAIEGDMENSRENNRNDAIAAQLLEITEGIYNDILKTYDVVV